MRYSLKLMLSAALVLGVVGCNDFLSGDGIDRDPNNITRLTRPGPLYVGIQALQSVQFEGQLARSAAEYVQQIAGNSRQQIGFDLYQMDQVTIDPHFYSVYGSSIAVQGGGGLLDIHKMQQFARAVNDSIYIGIGKVYEALVVGTAASIWGDIPYREAADSTNETPAFDSQLQVYGDVLAQLDSAVLFLAAAPGPPNVGPPADNSELVYLDRAASTADRAAVYTQVAHSLKARFHMHLAEVDPTHYALALAEVPLGINTPANDMLWYHDQSPGGAAGFFGFRPGGSTSLQTAPGVYNGTGAPGTAPAAYSGFNFIDSNTDPGDVRMPAVTWAETQLIGAEAAFQVGGAGAAQPYLDAARANRTYGSRGAVPIA